MKDLNQTNITKTIENLEKKLEEYDNKINSLTEENKNIQVKNIDQKNEDSKEIERLTQSVEGLNKVIGSLKEDINEKTTVNTNLTNKLNEANEEKQRLSDMEEALNKSKETIRRLNESLVQSVIREFSRYKKS